MQSASHEMYSHAKRVSRDVTANHKHARFLESALKDMVDLSTWPWQHESGHINLAVAA